MTRTLTYHKLISCLNQRISVFDFMGTSTELSLILDDETQRKLIPQLVSLQKLNAYYTKSFIKKYIQLIESKNEEVIEELYELYCKEEILNAVEMGPTDPDTALYSIGGFSTEQDSSNSLVLVQETPKLISGKGTTGLRTWEAALYFANYLNSNPINFHDQSICELGTGTGLVGLALAKNYHRDILPLKEITFTDGDAYVIENLSTTFQLNSLTSNIPTIRTQQLLWGTTSPSHPDFVLDPPFADYLIAADVTYDSSVLPLLCSTINDFFRNGTKMALIAATVRNENTLADWEQELHAWFGSNYKVSNKCDLPELISSNCWFKNGTPEIRIYQIIPTVDC